MRKLLTATVVSLLVASSAFAAGEVYRWKDANGSWHYSDQPLPGAELVRGAQHPVPGVARPAPAAAPAPSIPTDPSGAPVVSPEVAAQVRAEAATAKSEQCKKAEQSYQSSVQARRIFKTDAQGNRTYLSAAEMDAARLEARSNRDLACGP
ncbi:MAG: DUF4124 domain-containing protein [Steroidobacteraceae bacterium]